MGLSMPVLTVRKIWEKNTFSILTGITSLYDEKFYFLAFIIFFFSLVFPVTKLAALLLIWGVRLSDSNRIALVHWLGFLGKWSMLDVFVVAVIVVSVKLGVLASAEPKSGIYIFGLSILLSMVTTSLVDHMAHKQSSK